MAKRALKNQNRATKPCACGRADVYSDGRGGQPKLDGKYVCEECIVESLYAKYFNEQDK
jgi:hypothetical protein